MRVRFGRPRKLNSQSPSYASPIGDLLRWEPVIFFSKGTHLIFAAFCAGACVKLARGMRVHARENMKLGLLTFVQEGLYADNVRTMIHVKGTAPRTHCQCKLQGYSEPRRRWKWKTLIHPTTTARRVTGGLLVSYASRFSSGPRLAI